MIRFWNETQYLHTQNSVWRGAQCDFWMGLKTRHPLVVSHITWLPKITDKECSSLLHNNPNLKTYKLFSNRLTAPRSHWTIPVKISISWWSALLGDKATHDASKSSCLIELECTTVKMELESRPRTNGLKFTVGVGGLYLRDKMTQGSIMPVLVAPQSRVRDFYCYFNSLRGNSLFSQFKEHLSISVLGKWMAKKQWIILLCGKKFLFRFIWFNTYD